MPWQGQLGLQGVGRPKEDWDEKGRRRQVVGWGRESGGGPGQTLTEGHRAGCGFAIVRDR